MADASQKQKPLRLRELLRRIREARPLLQLGQPEHFGIGGQPYIRYPDRAAVASALHSLLAVPPLARAAHDLFVLDPISGTRIAQIQDSQGAMSAFAENIKALLKLMDMTEALLTSVLPPDNDRVVAIRLPWRDRLDGVGTLFAALQVALEQLVVDPDIDGSVTVRSFDIGSVWVEVFLNSLLAVKLVGAAVWVAIALLKKKREDDLLIETVERSKVKTETLEDLRSSLKAQQELLLRAQTEALERQHFKKSDNERIGRIMNTIRELAKMIDDGASVAPALTAPDDVTKLFPDLTKPLEQLSPPVQKSLPAHEAGTGEAPEEPDSADTDDKKPSE